MKDRMYDFVWLIQKKKTGNPSWKCRGCMGEFVGGPQRIRAHHEETGIAKCARPPDGAEDAAAVHEAKEREEKLKKLNLKKRKESAEEAATITKSKRQATISGLVTADLTHGDVHQAWAEAAYAIPLPLNVFESEYFKNAVSLTSKVNLPQSLRNSSTAPTYQPPSRYVLGKPLLAAAVATTTEQVASIQKIEAAKQPIALIYLATQK